MTRAQYNGLLPLDQQAWWDQIGSEVGFEGWCWHCASLGHEEHIEANDGLCASCQAQASEAGESLETFRKVYRDFRSHRETGALNAQPR